MSHDSWLDSIKVLLYVTACRLRVGTREVLLTLHASVPAFFPRYYPMMANPSQLYLLADHIKLSLLERQRAISLNLEPNSQDGHISTSLDSMREGVEALEREQAQLEEGGDT